MDVDLSFSHRQFNLETHIETHGYRLLSQKNFIDQVIDELHITLHASWGTNYLRELLDATIVKMEDELSLSMHLINILNGERK